MLAYKHLSFLNRIARPARAALAGQNLYDWIEDTVDGLPELTMRRYLDPDDQVLKAFGVSNVKRVASRPSSSWNASIRLSPHGHEMSILQVPSRSSVALIAHELGHALLYNHQQIWREIGRTRLLADPGQERLVDDIARSLLGPRRLMRAEGEAVTFEQVAHRIVETDNAPPKLAFARALSLTRERAVPSQSDLFRWSDVRPETPARTGSMMTLTPHLDEKIGERYRFIDLLKINKTLRHADLVRDLRFAVVGDQIDQGEAMRLVRKADHRQLSRFSTFSVVAVVPADDTQHVAIECCR